MRLGTSSPLVYDSGEHWAKYQKEQGCSAVVFPVQSNEPEKKIIEYKEAADREGLMIAEVGIWRNALSKNPDERKKNRDYCVEQLKLAEYLGARCCVNVAGTVGDIWDGAYKENFSKELRDETISMVREIIDRADVKNTYFTLEPMPWMIPTSPKDYAKLIDEIDRDRFAVHMDVINMINSIDRYFNAEEFVDECAEILGTKIRSCHIKDVHLAEKYTVRLEECAPGCGEFPLRYYVTKMNEIDPEMPVILEHLSTDEDYLKYLGYLKEELNGLYQTI
ncbi:sugar phosphate isomerase/epimerase family protein [Butyrivibrio sp. INlla14]|uniref:sugar phosphate isomerase/epimerase family protein n=1 Tax=Butyrivibrio sp. INlla14 TaxID=1520808 RepID=UPI0008767130|nr:TIM barrel protein [Butyrivibrio sp. INlla14]SCY15129.1 Sugar phosphate isomerase/epimerase [Butyrivibrio sp. INlla14]